MANVYGRITKITNAVGRSKYITDIDRQEEIVLHKKNMQHSWEEHSSFEKANQKTNVANNEALEVVVALPNELSLEKEKLEAVCDDLAKEIVGENKDYEYAVHWNKARTNLHLHLLFSERENQTELTPKIYKRDIYYNFEDKKLSKKSDPKAQIIHHKGDIQKDADGNIKYESDIFKAKDTKFIQGSFVHDKNRAVEQVMKSYGYDLTYQDKDSPFLAQKKLYKGASADYLEKNKAWNDYVKKYNEATKEYLDLNPADIDYCKALKKYILAEVKEANREEKKITSKAIEYIKDMIDWVKYKIEEFYRLFNQNEKDDELDYEENNDLNNYDNDLDFDEYDEEKDYNDDDIEILM